MVLPQQSFEKLIVLLPLQDSKMIKCKHLENSFIMLMKMSMGATIVENSIEVPQKIKN